MLKSYFEISERDAYFVLYACNTWAKISRPKVREWGRRPDLGGGGEDRQRRTALLDIVFRQPWLGRARTRCHGTEAGRGFINDSQDPYKWPQESRIIILIIYSLNTHYIVSFDPSDDINQKQMFSALKLWTLKFCASKLHADRIMIYYRGTVLFRHSRTYSNPMNTPM